MTERCDRCGQNEDAMFSFPNGHEVYSEEGLHLDFDEDNVICIWCVRDARRYIEEVHGTSDGPYEWEEQNPTIELFSDYLKT